MSPCADGEAVHHIKDLYYNFKYHVFQTFRGLLKVFLSATEFLARNVQYISLVAHPIHSLVKGGTL